VPRVVRVETLVHEVAPTERPVVRVNGRLAAWPVVPVRRLGADTLRVASQDTGPEPALVLPPVPALARAAAPLLCRPPVLGAAPALVGVLGAARGGAHSPACSPGHDHLDSVRCRALGVVCMKRLSAPLGIVATGLFLAIGCRVAGWLPGVVLGAVIVLGGLAAEWAERGKRRR